MKIIALDGLIKMPKPIIGNVPQSKVLDNMPSLSFNVCKKCRLNKFDALPAYVLYPNL